jgi:hypothetical protein
MNATFFSAIIDYVKRRKPASRYEGKSLKTFFLYAIAVILVIVIALAIKLFLVIRVSKFDSQHQFIIAVAVQGNVREILSYDPSSETTSALQMQGAHVTLDALGKTVAIIPHATVNFSQDVSLENDATQPLWQMITHYNLAKKDFTFYDLGRLYLFSKSVPQVNRQERTLALPTDTIAIDKQITTLFSDPTITQENVTVQVINATNVSGLGQRLERVLANQGANVVAITTAQATTAHSSLHYFGDPSYTEKKFVSLLHYSESPLERQAIADIIITIGEDQKNTKNF